MWEIHGIRAFALACAAAAGTAHADAIWQSDWFWSSPPTLARAFGPREGAVAFAADGDVLLGAASYDGQVYQITRLSPDGSLRWSANVGANLYVGYASPNATVATADGGALIPFGGYIDGSDPGLARIDANGNVAWLRTVPAAAIAEVAPNRIVADGCRTLTMLDAASGDVVWQQPTSLCPTTPYVTVDASGNVYILAVDASGQRVVKHSVDGSILWNASAGVPAAGSAKILGISAGLALVDTPGTLLAFDADTGSLAWQVMTVGSVVLAGSPPVPIEISYSTLSRLAIENGIPHWSEPFDSTGTAVAVGDGLLVNTTGTTWSRVDLATGAIEWTTALPANDALGNDLAYLGFGGLLAGNFTAVARPSTSAAAPPFMQRVSFDVGALSVTIVAPAVQQGPEASSLADGSDRVVGAQTAWTTTGPHIRVRSLDAASGSTIWEQGQTLDVDSFPRPPYDIEASIGTAGDAVAAAATPIAPGYTGSLGFGELWLGLYDRAGGNPRWQTTMRDVDAGEMHALAPLADAAGDLFVGVGAAIPCDTGQCARATLYKVSKTDGSVVWRVDDEYATFGTRVYPNDFVVVGNDALVLGPFDGGQSSPSLKAISGANGDVRWSSDIFGPGWINHVLPAANGISVLAYNGWARLDAATGSPLWIGPDYAPPCTVVCNPAYLAVAQPNDDLIVAGQGDHKPLVTLLKGDGSGQFENWQLEPNSPILDSSTIDLRRDTSGGIWIHLLRRTIGGTAGLAVLAKFDPAAGTLASQQVLRGRSGDSLNPIMYSLWLGSPEADHLLVKSISSVAPAPTAWGSALLDTRITAHGDVALALDVDRTHANLGQTLAFHARMTYAGDAAIDDAHLDVYLPWASGVRSPHCEAAGASGCAMDLRGGHLHATFNAEPGAVVDVSGEVLVLDASSDETPTLSAVAYGPIGLDESDTVNNIARQVISQGVFADGFDGS